MQIADLFKSSWQKIKSWRLKTWLMIGGGLLATPVIVMSLLVMAVALEWTGPLPDEEELRGIKNDKASEIYAEDGTLLGKYYLENRSEVDLSEMSPKLLQALVATEDARFYEHSGVDVTSLARVAVKSILMGNSSSGGGSTISQQLAKNLYPRQSFALLSLPINKVREMIIARRLERVYGKQKILELYLNTVPFGESVFGIGAATQRFFQTNPADIEVEKAATLVGMLKATTAYNPRLHEDRSLQRRNVVLALMGQAGYLRPEEVDSLSQRPMGLDYYNQGKEDGLAPYFRQQAAQEIRQWLRDRPGPNGDVYNLFTDGLKIYTTIDPVMQDLAEKAMAKHMARLQEDFDRHWQNRTLLADDDPVLLNAIRQSDRYRGLRAAGRSDEAAMATFDEEQNMMIWTWEGEQAVRMTPRDSVRHHLSFLQVGFLAMEPQTGYIRAWVGGINHKRFQYDHVTARRQVGSTFKPIIYASAIANGVDPCEYFANEKVVYEDYEGWAPGNADGNYEGFYSLTGGLTHSVNTVSAAVMMRVGVNQAWEFARKFGFSSELPKAPSLVLGTADIQLREMVAAYSTFANRGVRSLPVYITKIVDANGVVIAEWPRAPETKRVMDATQADMMANMLRSVVNQGTGSRMKRVYGIRMDLGGKTGTTQDQTDGWFVGVTPRLVVGAWVGGEARKIRFRSLGLGQGANTALPICGLFLQEVQRRPEYNSITNARFREPGISALQSMDCDLYVEQLGMRNGLNDLFDILQDNRRSGQQRNPGTNPEFERNRRQRRDMWDRIIPDRRNR